MVELTDLQRRIAMNWDRPMEPEEVAEALNISVETATRELDGMRNFIRSKFTDRQWKIAELYNGGLGTTQAKVAEELGVSRATVARALKAMRDFDNDFVMVIEIVEPDFPDFFQKIYHRRDLAFDAEDDYQPPFHGKPRISRSTAYRRTAKEWGYAPEQTDKILHELKIARRAIGRAIKAVGEEPVSEAAVSELTTIAKWVREFAGRADEAAGIYTPPEG